MTDIFIFTKNFQYKVMYTTSILSKKYFIPGNWYFHINKYIDIRAFSFKAEFGNTFTYFNTNSIQW